jgi:hypothetical protein
MKKVKRKIWETVDEFSAGYLGGSLESAVEYLQELQAKYGPTVDLFYNKDYYYSYDNSPTPMYIVKITREETDEEYDKRMAEERARETAAAEQERKEFERLKVKFGSGK